MNGADVTEAVRSAFLASAGVSAVAVGGLTSLRMRPGPTSAALSTVQLPAAAAFAVSSGEALVLQIVSVDALGNAQVVDAAAPGDQYVVTASAPGLPDVFGQVALAQQCTPGPAPNCSWPASYAAGSRQPTYTARLAPAVAANYTVTVRLQAAAAGASGADGIGAAGVPVRIGATNATSFTLAVTPGAPSPNVSMAAGAALIGFTAGQTSMLVLLPHDAHGNRITSLSAASLHALSCGAVLEAPDGQTLSFGGSASRKSSSKGIAPPTTASSPSRSPQPPRG